MEMKKKQRTVLRTAATKGANEMEVLLKDREVNSHQGQVLWEILAPKYDKLSVLDAEIYEGLLTEGASEEDLLGETYACDVYQKRYAELRISLDNLLADSRSVRNKEPCDALSTHSLNTSGRRKFKLPIIEFKKFAGDIRDWLPFWAQFKKVHEDPEIDLADKISYLIQATVPDSRARQLIESYPAIGENYTKIIEGLQSRFGREDLQIEVYVRELLKLILCNATSPNQLDLSTLYDKLETQLRSLETLSISSDKYSAILYPLIESCLPQELLRAWQRAPVAVNVIGEVGSGANHRESTLENRLKGLMLFIRSEVENEQRIMLAAEGFGVCASNFNVGDESIKRRKPKLQESSIPTAAGLINYNSTNCLFCAGTHASESCFKAQKFTYEQKKHLLAEKKACFRCLKPGHSSKSCRGRLRCLICGKSHVALMCPELPMHKSEPKCQYKKQEGNVNKDTDKVLANHDYSHVFLQTVRVNINGKRGSRVIRALFDNGSQRSYILQSTAERLGYMPKRKEKIVHCLFGGTEIEQGHNCYEVKLNVGNYSCSIEALDQPLICNDIRPVFAGPWMEELRGLNIQLSDTHDTTPIELLIGADFAGKLYTGKRHNLQCGLVAFETLLGWTIMGKVPSSELSSTATTVLSMFVQDASITDLWGLEILGITDPTEKRSRAERELAAKGYFQNTIETDAEGRYEVKLPWLEEHPPLPDNYYIAKRRLEATLKKLKDAHLVESYDLVFQEWLAEGIIEEVPMTEFNDYSHYMPHRPVIKENSTTKIRPVFDASARENNKPSLNQCLEKGPNLIELIPAILLRFRNYKYGVISDIRKAFLQISVHEADRNFLRFLWTDSDGKEKRYRHRRVVFGVSSSPFLLGATIEYHLEVCLKKTGMENMEYSCDTIQRLSKSFYVDNCVTSVPDEHTLKRFIRESSVAMAEAKFDLRGWEFTQLTGNSIKVPVLGLIWNTNKDVLTVNNEFLDAITDIENKLVTKRLILSAAQRLFDPIGFTCPVTLSPKLLLQRIWKKQLGWDEQVDAEIEHDFLNWLKELPYLSKIEIPRWVHLVQDDTQPQSLHIFCDASQTAYSVVIFLRVMRDNEIFVHLLAAKARVAPLKRMTIPRLELLAATIGARMYEMVKEQVVTKCECFFWSDSATVVSWIRRNEEWSTFVMNRVSEIRTLTPKEAWRHIPGALNPADLPSRGCAAKKLVESKWWEGPSWLYKEKYLWPQDRFEFNEEEICVEKKKRLGTISLFNSSSENWHFTYFSSYIKTVRMIGWIFRFIYNVRNSSEKRVGVLTVEEIDRAEIFVVKAIQQEYFSGETNKQISALHPYYDESGVIRIKSRISNREDSNNFRFPVVLPAKHPLVHRLIFELHKKSCHVRTQGLLSILREKYWILGGRRTVRSIISKCVVCKRYSTKPLQVSSPPLPIDRVRDAVAFEITGVDFAGPLYLKTGEKAWVCLFTCAIYRAVHLELTTSLSTSNFIQVFRRFVSRRGRPTTVYSDNGLNFVGTENAFKRLDWKTIVEHTSVQRIKWRFNPPSAPWWGGFWERLIGIVKSLLRKVLGRACLNYEDLLTLICDCEAIVNSRPLTYLSNDATDLIPLTPSMYLRDLAETGLPDCDEIEKSSLCKKIIHKQKLRADLRRRFRSEYLGHLKLAQKDIPYRSLRVGEIVLVGNDLNKRIDWPLGRVIELIPGKDQQVRLVKIKTPRGQLLRPVQRIYPLECVPDSDDDVEVPVEKNNDSDDMEDVVQDIGDCAVVSDVETDIKSRVPENELKVTRSGRVSRLPSRLNY